jgi:hypothetical protein
MIQAPEIIPTEDGTGFYAVIYIQYFQYSAECATEMLGLGQGTDNSNQNPGQFKGQEFGVQLGFDGEYTYSSNSMTTTSTNSTSSSNTTGGNGGMGNSGTGGVEGTMKLKLRLIEQVKQTGESYQGAQRRFVEVGKRSNLLWLHGQTDETQITSECVLNETVGTLSEFVELHITNQFFLKAAHTDMGKAPVDSFKNSFRITQWPWGGQGNQTVTDKLKLEFFISSSTKDKPNGVAYLGPRRPDNGNPNVGSGNNSTNSSGDTSGSGSIGSSSGFGNDTTSGSSSVGSGSQAANDTGASQPQTGAAGLASSSGPATTNDTTSGSSSLPASGSEPANGTSSSSQDTTDGSNSTTTTTTQANSTQTTTVIKNKGEVNFDNFGQMLFFQKVELKSSFDELGPKLTEIEGPELRHSEDGTGYIITIYFPYFKYSAFYDPMVNGKPVLSESPEGGKAWWDGLSYANRIGFIIGVCIAFILLVLAITWCCCRTRNSQDAAPARGNQASAEGGSTHYHAAPRSSQSQ